MNLEISKMLTLSTAHIKPVTSNYLDREDRAELVVYPKPEYGWFIYLGGEYLEGELQHVPEDLAQVIRLALNNECLWLCLDCDGDEIEQLPTYDW